MPGDKNKDRALNAAVRANVGRQTRLIKDTRGEIVRLLELALSRARGTLAAQPSDYQQWLLPQITREIELALADFSRDGAAKVGQAASDAWELGQGLVDQPLEAGGIRVAAVAPRLDTRQLFAMRSFMTDRIKDIGVEAANQINTQLGLVVIGAQSPSEATTAVTEILGESSRGRALRIVRDELNRAYSSAAQQRMEQAGRFVKGLRKQWKRSGKLHPRPSHYATHGQVRDVDQPFDVGGRSIMYPRDPAAGAAETINCGCMAVPYMESWAQAAA